MDRDAAFWGALANTVFVGLWFAHGLGLYAAFSRRWGAGVLAALALYLVFLVVSPSPPIRIVLGLPLGYGWPDALRGWLINAFLAFAGAAALLWSRRPPKRPD